MLQFLTPTVHYICNNRSLNCHAFAMHLHCSCNFFIIHCQKFVINMLKNRKHSFGQQSVEETGEDGVQQGKSEK